MLVVKIELWPHGEESWARSLGVAHIANDGTGDGESGNYWVKLFETGRLWKTGEIKDFRRRLGPWNLLCRALNAAIGKNP